MTVQTQIVPVKRLLTVEETLTKHLDGKVGRNTLYGAIRSGALTHIRIGRRVLLTPEAVEAWLATLTHQAG